MAAMIFIFMFLVFLVTAAKLNAPVTGNCAGMLKMHEFKSLVII
jgi:hypothetical protein